MGKRIKKLKKIRIHREGTDQLLYGFLFFIGFAIALWFTFDQKWPFWLFIVVYGIIYAIIVNFYQCPIRYLDVEDTGNIVVAPADGKIVVIEEVDENTYFHDRRLMISIFMSLTNVHANWFPVDGKVKFVKHFNGNYHKAWLPNAKEGEECFIDEHLGFIKLGSRVDVLLPVDSEVCVTMGQKTTGDQTIIARLRQ